MKVWVLTRDINEYNQDGEYFVAVFRSMPEEEQLLRWCSDKTAKLLASGLSDDPHVYSGPYETFYLNEEDI